MLADDERLTWIASYPKSGNTWLRCLIQAYRTGGFLDINDLHTAHGDSASCYTRAVSPLPLSDLGMRGQWLLRPAALLAAMMSKPRPRMFKTHYANLTVSGVPAFIPPEYTQRALYVVRDPRSVVLSMMRHFSLSPDKAVEQMNNKEFFIGQHQAQTEQLVSSWSNHVASWIAETRYPVHCVKYEDLCDNPERELCEVVEFLGLDYDEDRCRKAVRAAQLSRLQKNEKEQGFEEWTQSERGRFFGAGGTRWRDELSITHRRAIERDHGTVMEQMGYAVEHPGT